ncbi:3-hydroxyacyl-CoA dehydrogenase NAD-binding domain-containing protein, partial [uncultured Corynebacterium sp.]|uniref:3-hydroxyacyl-CoA dehydrogenase NAD-binding domain-containing protein n=1 Tax=uncultured Corynebacterium sp. TaxID=159447 RepID=UPI0025FB9278
MHPHFDTTSTVVVIGLGYIGLPTAAFLADAGVQVVGVDINQTTVDKVNSGIVPFVEKGFDELLKKVVSSGRLTATTEVPEGDAFIITVPTPFQEDHSVDDSYVMAAADNIIPVLRGGELVVLESTS